jgi:hypothetical protein
MWNEVNTIENLPIESREIKHKQKIEANCAKSLSPNIKLRDDNKEYS